VNLLLCEDPEEATRLAEQLNQNNADRQQLTDHLFNESVEQLKATDQEKNAMLFTFGETWSPGVIGIVAGKIMNEYYRPTIVMGLNKGMIVGSGRSLKEFNLIAAMQSMPEFFHKYGGHPQACGFTLKDASMLEEFKKKLLEKATEATKTVDLSPQLAVDAEIDLEDITWELYDLLQKFEPFGQMNPEPKYAAYGLTVVDIQPLGKEEKHLRLLVKHNSHVIKKTIGFGLGDPSRHPMKWKEVLKPGDKIDMVFSIGVNEWNGNRELQLMIEDIRKN
jgi:single-stranded-DNA-specific exonuclease